MSGAGAPNLKVQANGLNIAVIAGSWHQDFINPMIADAQQTIAAAGAQSELFYVAGSFELPLAAQAAAAAGYDAIVCLGVIVRGGTPHFEYVCNAVTDGLTRVQLDSGKPVGFGVLTVDNEQQAAARAGGEGASEFKGKEAAEAALHLAVTVAKINKSAK